MAGAGRLISGQYRLIEKVGRGGFGVVWRAHDEQLDRVVAAKELFLPAYLAEGQRQERRTRSLREARSAARLDHRGAVRVYDVVEHDDGPWIIMEFLKGRSLEDIVKNDGPLPVDQVAEIGLQILGALCSAHAAGVIHRDVKPSNVLIGEGRAVLTDFGIATIEGDTSITQSGFVMGAPAYTAPERARGEPATAASDLWSLGATLYYAVEGGQPFAGSNANQVFHSIITGLPGPIRRAGALGPLIEGLLQKDAEQRLTASDAALILTGAAQLSDPDKVTTLPNRWRNPQLPEPKRKPAQRRRPLIPLVLIAAAFTTVAVAWNLQGGTAPTRITTSAERPPSYSLLETAPLKGLAINAIVFSPDSKLIAIGNQLSSVGIWDVQQRKLVASWPTGNYWVTSVAFSPQGDHLATGGYNGEVRVFPLADPEHPKVMAGDLRNVRQLGFSPDGKTVAAASSTVRVWMYGTKKRPIHYGTDESYFAVAFEPKNGVLAWAENTRVMLGERTLFKGGELLTWLAYDPAGTRFAIADQVGNIRLYDAQSRRPLVTFNPNGHAVNAVAFNPDGSRIAVVAGNQVTIWDTTTVRQPLITLDGGIDLLTTVAFSPDGTLVAAAGDDAKLRIWRV